MARLTFSMGAPVHCEHGEVGGKLTHLVIHANSYRVTALIVARGLPLVSNEARVVPVAAVKGTTEKAVWLSMSGDALANCAAYQAAFLAVEDPAARAVPTFDATGGGYGTAPVSPPIRQHLHRGRAEYHLILGPQTEVRTLHGPVGTVERLLVDQERSAITQVVTRKGLLRVAYLIIPAEMIEAMSDDEILLAASHQEIEALSRSPT